MSNISRKRRDKLFTPVPAPCSTAALINNNVNEGGNNQNLILFIRGNAISGAPNIKGTNQFPNPPTITGITKKKIIKNPWAVTICIIKLITTKYRSWLSKF